MVDKKPSTDASAWGTEIVHLADSYDESALRAQLAEAEQDTCCEGGCFVCVLATRCMLQQALQYKRETTAAASK